MSVLVTVAPGKLLAAAPAASYTRARAAGCPAGITSAYRSPQSQAALRAAYLASPTTVAYAAPVALSEHVTGYALDLPAGGPREWFAAHGAAYGWIRTDPRESWHYAYRVARDEHLTDGTAPPAPITPTPPPPPTQEDDMPTIIRAGAAGAYLLDGGNLLPLAPDSLASAEAAGLKSVTISAELFGTWNRSTDPLGVLVRDAVSGSVALSVSGSPFVTVPDPQTYSELLGQGIPVIPVPPVVFAALMEVPS